MPFNVGKSEKTRVGRIIDNPTLKSYYEPEGGINARWNTIEHLCRGT